MPKLLSNDRARPARSTSTGTGSKLSNGDSNILPDLGQFTRRVLQDALNDGRRQWWLKRAEDFERAKPTLDDFNGEATVQQLRARWRWCHETAQACRSKAALVAMTPDEFDAEIEAVWAEVNAA